MPQSGERGDHSFLGLIGPRRWLTPSQDPLGIDGNPISPYSASYTPNSGASNGLPIFDLQLANTGVACSNHNRIHTPLSVISTRPASSHVAQQLHYSQIYPPLYHSAQDSNAQMHDPHIPSLWENDQLHGFVPPQQGHGVYELLTYQTGTEDVHDDSSPRQRTSSLNSVSSTSTSSGTGSSFSHHCDYHSMERVFPPVSYLGPCILLRPDSHNDQLFGNFSPISYPMPTGDCNPLPAEALIPETYDHYRIGAYPALHHQEPTAQSCIPISHYDQACQHPPPTIHPTIPPSSSVYYTSFHSAPAPIVLPLSLGQEPQANEPPFSPQVSAPSPAVTRTLSISPSQNRATSSHGSASSAKAALIGSASSGRQYASRGSWPCKFEDQIFAPEEYVTLANFFFRSPPSYALCLPSATIFISRKLAAVKRRRIYINSLELQCNQLQRLLEQHGLLVQPDLSTQSEGTCRPNSSKSSPASPGPVDREKTPKGKSKPKPPQIKRARSVAGFETARAFVGPEGVVSPLSGRKSTTVQGRRVQSQVKGVTGFAAFQSFSLVDLVCRFRSLSYSTRLPRSNLKSPRSPRFVSVALCHRTAGQTRT